MSILFSGPPKPPALPKQIQPENPQLQAVAQAQNQKQGAAAASLLTQQSGRPGASLFGS